MTERSLKHSDHSVSGWSALFWLSASEGLIALGWIASLPSDAEPGRFLGFSTSRLLLMGLLLALIAGSSALAVIVRRGVSLSHGIKCILFVLLPFAALACGLLPAILMMLYRTAGEFRYLAYYQRLLPLFLWGLLVSLQSFGVLACKGGFDWPALRDQRAVFKSGLIVWAIFALIGILVLVTGIGRIRDVIGWGGPTVSLMEWQIWLGWGAASAFALLLTRIGWAARHDRMLVFAIWLLAVAVWLAVPVRPAFFATAGRAPNYEIYPFSDGAYYDHFAQSALIGDGFKGNEIPARPFYVTLLVAFHLIAGQEYQKVIAVQTLLLALFPVVLFLLGKELHSRPAGLMAALLAILREALAAYAMPFTDNASNSKLFFADLPTALVAGLWALLVVRWIKSFGVEKTRGTWVQGMLIGGTLGLAMLFRTQTVFMLPGILLLALLASRLQWRRWLVASVLVALGLALVLAPWLVRNTVLTGRVAFDDDKSQTGVMAQRYSLSGMDEAFLYRPGEDLRAFSQRSVASIFNFLFSHPGVVAQFVTGHFLNAEIDNLLMLPIRYQLPDLHDLVTPSTAFWESWNGSLSPGQSAIVLLNLGVIALGMGAGWSRARWAGLAPLVINISYHFSNALARNSGGRYLLVADWVLYVYAALGFLEITLALLAVFGVPTAQRSALLTANRLNIENPHLQKSQRWQKGGTLGIALLLIGAAPVFADQFIPARYAPQTQADLTTEIARNPALAKAGLDSAAVNQIAAQPGMVAVKGRLLYPRYYAAGEGEPRTAKTGYEPLDYPRTVMLMTSNTYNGLVILKAEGAPRFLPDAADVILLACPATNASTNYNYLDARLLLVLTQPGVAYRTGEDIGLPCTQHAEMLP